MALPRSHDRVLAETECAVCQKLAVVKVRADGWIDIRCGDCGYVESALGDKSFEAIMSAVIGNDATTYRRTDKSSVVDALGIVTEPEPEPEPEREPENAPKIEKGIIERVTEIHEDFEPDLVDEEDEDLVAAMFGGDFE